MMSCLRICAVALLFMLCANTCSSVQNRLDGSGVPWNLVMANTVAHTDTYWVRRPILLSIDVWEDLQLHASEKKHLRMRMSWEQSCTDAVLQEQRAKQLLIGKLSAESQIALIDSSMLWDALTWDNSTRWRTLVVEIVGFSDEVVAYDTIPIRIVDSYEEAAISYGFHHPCSEGRTSADVAEGSRVPRVLHFIHLFPEQDAHESVGGETPLADRTENHGEDCSVLFLLAVRAAVQVEAWERVIVHWNRIPAGERCRQIREMTEVLPIARPTTIIGNAVTWPQHQADVVRLHALRRWGGVYLDTDALIVAPLGELLAFPGVTIGAQTNGGICNGIILAGREAAFMRLWLAHYSLFREGMMGLLGSYYPSLLAMAHPRLIRVLPPQRLHWPSFDPVGMRALWFARWAPLPAAEQPVLHVWGSSLQELGRLVGTDEALVAPGASSPISCALEAAGVLPRSSTRRRTCDPVKAVSSRGDRDGPLAVWSLGQGAEELDLPSTPEGLTGTLYRETPSEDVGEDARGHYPRWVGDELWFAGTGGASLPFAGLYHAREVTFTWRAKLGCTDAECGEQVMWQALQSLPFWLEMVAIPELEESPDASGGQVGLRSVWFEALLQRDPFVHTVATARVLLPTRGAQGEIPWIRFALSLAHGLPPVLRVAVEDTLEGKAAAQENTTRGTSGGCDYSAPMADTFIDECLQDVEIGRTQHAQECETAYPRLSEAVAECNRRQACSGVTFTPLGVFELRAGRVYPGQSGRSEISWVRQSCDSIMNVVPVERCLTGRASERRRFTCFRSGTGLPFQIGYASWCPPRGSFAPPAPPGEPALRRLAHHQAHTHRMLTGCSNDFWFLDESGVLGIWLGSRAGAASALKSLGRAEFFGALHDFRVWESYWDDEWEANWRRGELGRSGPAKMESDMRLDQCASPGEIDCVDADDGTYAGVEVEIEWPRMFSLVDDSEFHERGVLKVRVSGKGDASLRASPAEVVVSVNGATFFQETHSAAWRDGDGGGDGNTLVLQFAVRDAPSFESLATGRLPLGWSVIEARALDSAGKLLGDTASWFFTHHDRLEGGYWHPGQASQRCGEQGQCSTDATVQRSEKGWEDGCAEDLRAASDAAAAAAKGCKTPAPAQALAYAFWVLGVRSVLDIGSGGLEWLPWFPSALEEASDGEWRLGEKGPSEEHAPAVLEYLAVDPSPGVRQRLRAQPGVPGVKLRVEDGEAGDVRIDMRQTQSGQQTAGQVARDVGNDANEDAQQSAVPHLVVLRGLLPLLSLREAHDLYLRVARSGAQYLLVTSHPGIVANSDARHTFSGQRFRPLNMPLEPFLNADALGWWPEDCHTLWPITGGWPPLNSTAELVLVDLEAVRAAIKRVP